MAGYRKLGRTSSQRKALLRNQVTALLNNGKIVTTEAKAKEVRKIAESLIALAVKERDNFDTVTVSCKVARKDKDGHRVKETVDGKKKTVYDTIEKTIQKDQPSRLHARRQIMKVLYPVHMDRKEKESKSDFKERTGDVKYPLVEKLFNELAPKYDERVKTVGTRGGYTRILKKGPRRGDAAEVVIVELV